MRKLCIVVASLAALVALPGTAGAAKRSTVVGASAGAVAGAVVGGPVGAVVGGAVGGYAGSKYGNRRRSAARRRR